MYEVQSGEIQAGVIYQVLDDSITYNSTTYSPGEYFTGVDGVTDFTTNSTSSTVTYASYTNAIAVPYEVPALYHSPNNLFTDESTTSVFSVCVGPITFQAKLTRSGACDSETTIDVETNYFET